MNMGNNFGVPTMIFNFYEGRSQNEYDSEESSSSSSESEEEAACNNFQSDSAATFPRPDFVGVESVRKFEQSLDLGETLSLIFLLFDDQSYALQTMKVLVAQGSKTFSKSYISDWVMKKGPSNVSGKLLEALAVIQNYRILRDLGVSKTEADERFLPSRDCTLYLNRVKKMLYLLVDSLSLGEATAFVTNCQNDGRELFKTGHDITLKCNPRYTEFYLLFWIDRGYITIEKERINLDNLISVMTDSRKHLVQFILSPKVKSQLEELKNMVKDITKQKVLIQTYEDNIYPIYDEKNVGLMLIINIDNFDKREECKQYLNLLSPEILSNRKGSEEDVRKLHVTFTVLNFKVVTIHNICHYEMQEKIETEVMKNYSPNHSMLFLCILSHGSEGVIYGSNSCPVRIKDIQNMISGKSEIGRIFANKPKSIIVQACQGFGRLCVEPEPVSLGFEARGVHYQLDCSRGSCLDGPSRSSEHADVLVCLAVIEGYAAVRHQKQGSFYIHQICKSIIKYRHQEHFEEIILRVHKSLNEMKVHVQLEDVRRASPCAEGHMNCAIMFMTPKKESTLRCKLYLTKLIQRS